MSAVFRKPTLADIYIKELAQVERTTIPLYPPNAPDTRLGTIGRFANGTWERRGHLDDLLGGEGSFAAAVPPAPPTSPASFSFRSEGGVHLTPTGTATVMGKELLSGRLSFERDRAVVASFVGVVQSAVRSPRDFDRLLWKLYLEGELSSDEVVVAVHQRAASGTVLVNRKGGVDVDFTVDPALGGMVSLEGLGVGVQFGAGSQASAQVSGTDLSVGVELKGLSPDEVNRVVSVRNFAPTVDAAVEQLEDADVPCVTVAALLDGADFDRPEA